MHLSRTQGEDLGFYVVIDNKLVMDTKKKVSFLLVWFQVKSENVFN